MNTREIRFDVHALIRLISHYTCGEVPNDAEVVDAGPSEFFSGWFGILTRSKQWPPGSEKKVPYHFRYRGKRTLTFDEKGQDPEYTYANPGTPRRIR